MQGLLASILLWNFGHLSMKFFIICAIYVFWHRSNGSIHVHWLLLGQIQQPLFHLLLLLVEDFLRFFLLSVVLNLFNRLNFLNCFSLTKWHFKLKIQTVHRLQNTGQLCDSTLIIIEVARLYQFQLLLRLQKRALFRLNHRTRHLRKWSKHLIVAKFRSCCLSWIRQQAYHARMPLSGLPHGAAALVNNSCFIFWYYVVCAVSSSVLIRQILYSNGRQQLATKTSCGASSWRFLSRTRGSRCIPNFSIKGVDRWSCLVF